MRMKSLGVVLAAAALLAASCSGSDAGSDEGAATTVADSGAGTTAAPADDGGESGGQAPSGDPIKIGIIADLTGPFTTYGTSLANSAQLAVDEINAAGGIDGRPVEAIVEDIQTDVTVTVDKARKLVESDQVSVVIGPIGSDANDAAFKAVAEDGNTLLFYPETYEGGKCNANFFSFGAVPAQQIRPLVAQLQEEYGPNVMLFGADYVWPHRTFEIARPIIEENGGTVVEELYLPLIADDFTELVTSVRDNEPDYIFSLYPALWGPALKALDDAGVLGDVGVGTTFLGDPDLASVGALAADDYTALPYFTSSEGDAAAEFLANFQAAYGADAIPSGGEAVGAYNAVYMYKAAVEKAGTTDTAAVSEALVGLSIDGPTGAVTMDQSHHLEQTITLVQADDAGSYHLVESFPGQATEESCG